MSGKFNIYLLQQYFMSKKENICVIDELGLTNNYFNLSSDQKQNPESVSLILLLQTAVCNLRPLNNY